MARSDKATTSWMNSRKPGGDFRLILGQITKAEQRHVFGLTFQRGVAYTPFFETPQQISDDIERGYPYHRNHSFGGLKHTGPIDDYGGSFPGGYTTRKDPRDWIGEAVAQAPTPGDFTSSATLAIWSERWDSEDYWGLITKRTNRLAAWFPIR